MALVTPSVFSLAADRLDPPPYDPVQSAQDRLGVTLWSKQQEIIRSVFANRRTAVKSCHDSGKSFTAAVAVAEWLSYWPPGSAFVLSTAPRWQQVRAILWREIGKLHRTAKLPGRVNQTEWHLHDELVGFGRKPADWDDSGFQGIHAEHVLIIVDEACGIPRPLWDAASTAMTNDASRILAIGNPDSTGNRFEELFMPGSGWHTITIKAWDTPNFTGEWVPPKAARSLLSPTWVDEKRDEWGDDDPRWIAKVEAEFPTDADDGVVKWSHINNARTQSRSPKCTHDTTHWPPGHDLAGKPIPVVLGVDVGGGRDRTVIRERRGWSAGRRWSQSTPEPEQATDLIIHALRETGASTVNIDAVGIGWGIAGDLRRQCRMLPELRHVKVNPVKVSQAPTNANAKRFKKLRDEVWWHTRELFEQGIIDLSVIDPNGRSDDPVFAELKWPKWHIADQGKIKVEGKDEIIERMGHSPDDADAFNLAFWTGASADRRTRSH